MSGLSLKDFNIWKWRVLHKRRIFVLPLLNLLLTFSWAVVYTEVTGSGDMIGLNHHRPSKELSERDSRIFDAVPLIFFYFHGASCAVIVLTRWGRNMIHEHQGRRLCEWCAFSLLLAIFYLSYPLYKDRDEFTTQAAEEMCSLLAMLVSLGITSFHHIGLPQRISWIVLIISTILWISFMKSQHMSVVAGIALLLSSFILYVGTSVQEQEYKRSFGQQRDINNKKSGFGNLDLDLACTLSTIDSAISHLYAVLDEDGLVVSEKLEDGMWHWSPRLACLQEQKHLCQSIYVAWLSEDAAKRAALSTKSQFSFNKMCTKLFGMFEGTVGCSLPLYTDDTVPEVFITAPQGMFDLVLFLLIYNAVQGDSIYFLACESVEHGWLVSVQIAVLEDQVNFWDNASTNGYLIRHNNQAEDHNAMRLGNISTDLVGIAHQLMPDDQMFGKSSAIERLAHRIAERHLNSKIEFADPEYKSGLTLYNRSFKLPNDAASTIQGMSFASSSAQSSIRQNWLFVDQRVNDADLFTEIKEKLKLLSIPITACAGHELKNLTEKYRVVVVHEGQLVSFKEALSKDIPKVALCTIVLYDSEVITEEMKSRWSFHVNAHLACKASMHELFRCIQDKLAISEPRPVFADDVFKGFASGLANLVDPDIVNVPNNNNNNTLRTNASGKAGRRNTVAQGVAQSGRANKLKYHNRPQDPSVQRWINMLSRLEMEIQAYRRGKPDFVNSLSSILEGCKHRIDTMKAEAANRNNGAPAAMLRIYADNGELAQPSDADCDSDGGGGGGPKSGSWGSNSASNIENASDFHQKQANTRVMQLLEPLKRKTKHVVEKFIPVMAILRKHLADNNFSGIHDVCKDYAKQSAEFGLGKLNCWFVTLLDICEVLRGNFMAGLQTLSPSGKLTIDNKPSGSATTSTSGKQSNSWSSSTASAAAKPGVVQHANSGSTAAVNSMTLSGADKSGEYSQDSGGGGGAGGDDSRSSSARKASTRKGGDGSGGGVTELDDDGDAPWNKSYVMQVPDIRVKSIIMEMMDAIEVAIWDAAVEKTS